MLQSFDSLEKLSKEFMDASLTSLAAVSKSSQSIAMETSDYAKRAVESGSAIWEEIAGAASIEKALEAQSKYARQAYEGFVAQTTRLSELYTDLARDAFKPFESAIAKSR